MRISNPAPRPMAAIDAAPSFDRGVVPLGCAADSVDCEDSVTLSPACLDESGSVGPDSTGSDWTEPLGLYG